MAKFDPIKSSDQIVFVSMLQIWNFRYFWIIICIGLESIIFAINVDAVSFSKVINTFDYMFLSSINLSIF